MEAVPQVLQKHAIALMTQYKVFYFPENEKKTRLTLLSETGRGATRDIETDASFLADCAPTETQRKEFHDRQLDL